MRIAITGSSGLIGTALTGALTAAGHTVVPLVRAAPGPGQVRWDPRAGTLDPKDLAGIDAAVHLAGAGIGDKRWTPQRKAEIIDSRRLGTDLLSRTLAQLDPAPQVLVSGSAIGFYGDRGSDELTEDSPPGDGFLAEICQQWEGATAPADQAGIRVVRIRTGLVLSSRGGFLKKQLPLFKFGLGGRMGSGRQYLSWIAMEDEVNAILLALNTPGLRGPVNLTAPNPVTNLEFTAALGRAVHRPTVLPVPLFGVRLLMGRDLVEEALLGGQRVLPAKLGAAGFVFVHPDLDEALETTLNA